MHSYLIFYGCIKLAPTSAFRLESINEHTYISVLYHYLQGVIVIKPNQY